MIFLIVYAIIGFLFGAWTNLVDGPFDDSDSIVDRVVVTSIFVTLWPFVLLASVFSPPWLDR